MAYFQSDKGTPVGYAVVTAFGSPMTVVKHSMAPGDVLLSALSEEEADLALFSIYSRMNVDEVLAQIKDYPSADFNALFPMLYLIGKRVATVSDKRKIMDFFIERFNLRQSQYEERSNVITRFKNQQEEFRLFKSPLDSCLTGVSMEYANYFFEPKNWVDMNNALSRMFLNHRCVSRQAAALAETGKIAPEAEIFYHIFARSRWGQDLGLGIGSDRLPHLKETLGASHLGVRTLEIQDEILEGNLRPEFARELRNIVDRNFEMAFPVALEYARHTKEWDDVAYYAYRCLKNNVYGLQQQTDTLSGSDSVSYFDHLEFLLEGLSQTDAQAAGTLYEFISALPQTMKQNMWLMRAERILNGIAYDKDAAKRDGKVLAKKGFYENPELEARCREYFETSLKNM
ncbi:MAG: hypothetical protein IJX22_04195 [Opitutales bacterium]|nr:hypothetical protein [Opitutales bacterium]